ncbi:MAG: 2-hydroxychromene-2-carboxylate isomerase [Alphaproteobacteria bacterium]|nr:2-hydroxychromene-2-carboxylate isomerase [Alphaproteobacteria bacterium]
MARPIEFFLALTSPWTYLATPRVRALATEYNLELRFRPFDIFSVFQRNGIKTVGDRPAAVQQNRLNELRRWRAHLGMDLNLQPKHFPVDPTMSGKMLIAALDGPGDAPEFAFRVMRACWAEERDISDEATLTAVAGGCGFDGEALLAAVKGGGAEETLAQNTEDAITANVFGAPTFLFEGELYWGQDRIEFLRRAAEAAA